MSITYSLDELIIWDHPNSHLIILQSKRLLSHYDVFFGSGFNECHLDTARYETKRVDGGRKSYCRYAMPSSPHKLFVANGGIHSDKYASMRLATFRVIQQIFTYIFDFNWEGIEFHLTPTREGGFRCKSTKIKLPQRGFAKHNHFRTERITRAYERNKNYPAYCRIGAGIEFIDKLCHNLEYIGPVSSFRYKRYGWHKRAASFPFKPNKKHRSSAAHPHLNSNKNKNGSLSHSYGHQHPRGGYKKNSTVAYGMAPAPKSSFTYYKKYHPAPATATAPDHGPKSKKQRSDSNTEAKIVPVGQQHVQRGNKGDAGFNFGSLLEHTHQYHAVHMQQNMEQNLLNVQKNMEYEPGETKMRRKPVAEWSYYALIYWFNRVNKGAFSGIKYTNFRKHLYIGRVKGSELGKINPVILKMAGIMDANEHQMIMKTIHDLMTCDDFNNVVANATQTEDIPNSYFDPITYEIMQDPVVCAVSGNSHERRVIEEYIKLYKKDPCTQKTANLNDLVANKEMKSRIDTWVRANFDLSVV